MWIWVVISHHLETASYYLTISVTPPVSHPEWAMQLAVSGDIVNSSGRTMHCHFCSPEQAQPGSAALKTLSQDPCPAIKLPMSLKSTKIDEAKSL
ncbi:hypothetical protein DSO57_1033928, partial [Entomophthora muscae]